MPAILCKCTATFLTFFILLYAEPSATARGVLSPSANVALLWDRASLQATRDTKLGARLASRALGSVWRGKVFVLRIVMLLLFTLFPYFGLSQTTAATETGSMSGTVITLEGKPVPAAKVSALFDLNHPLSVKTGTDGHFF